MSYQQRPKRKKKGDRLLSPDATKNEVACDHAIAPFDRLATEMDRKWGIDQLPALVSPETASRYGQAVAFLNEAIGEVDPAKCIAAVNNCIRGLHALDAEATAAGKQPASGEYWEYDLEGFRFAVMPDVFEWQTAKAKRPDLQFYTMREVACALRHYATSFPIGEVKDIFPAAQIVDVKERTELEKELNDEIPDF